MSKNRKLKFYLCQFFNCLETVYMNERKQQQKNKGKGSNKNHHLRPNFNYNKS